jgi:2-desacetyl-2-hydroxyethyl bacteriochlorophyllide A dehydrogenase
VKAIRYHRGRPGVVCTDIPQPSAGPREVLVRVDAAGLCGTDVTIAYGAGGHMVSQDVLTLGHETAGTVAAVGPEVHGWRAGDRVAVSPIVTCGHCRYCDLGASENCNHAVVLGLGRDGSLAEFISVPSSTLVRLPDNVPATIGAIITDAVATPYHALLERARLTAGESIAVFGVGGLGQHAIQIARLAGAAPVIAIDPRPEQLELALALGADYVVDGRQDDVAAAVRRVNGGRGVDVAADFAGQAASTEAAFSALTKLGRAVIVGLGTEPVTLPPSVTFAMRQVSLMGAGGFSRLTIERIVALVAAGRLDLSSSVSHTIPLDAVSEALLMLRDKSQPVRRVVALPLPAEVGEDSPVSSQFADREEEAGGAGLPLGAEAGRPSLYGQLYFVPEAALGRVTAAELTGAVLNAQGQVPGTALGPAPGRNGSFCAAQFAISTDPPRDFDPELSMREPLELQVWPDGSFAVEIEFTGQDARVDQEAGQGVAVVLGPWASARGWRLLDLVNDRSRSLSDVWNATFLLLDSGRPVAEALDFARRAIAVAEAHRHEGRLDGRLLELLRAGDALGLIGTPVTSVFQPRPGARSDASGDFRLALDVCAFANSAYGGLVVLGLEDDGSRVTGVTGGISGDGVISRVRAAIERLVFPAPEGVEVEAVPSGTGDGQVVVVHVPPQEQVLKPFLVCGTIADGQLSAIGVTLVERRQATIYTNGIAALHSQIAAGRALLGGPWPS